MSGSTGEVVRVGCWCGMNRRDANSGGLVFVDESAQQVAAVETGGGGQRRWVAAVGRQQRFGDVRAKGAT